MAPPSKICDSGVKLRAIAYFKRVQNKTLTAKMFGVSESTVRMWIKCESRLRAQRKKAKKSVADNDGVAYAVLEKSMVDFVNRDHKRGVKTPYGKLLEHAAQLKKVHALKGLHVSLKWVSDFVTKQRLRSKCERLKSPAVDNGHVQRRKQKPPKGGRCSAEKSAAVKRAAKISSSNRSKVKKAVATLRTKLSKAKQSKSKMAASVRKTVKKQTDSKRTLKNRVSKLKKKGLLKHAKKEDRQKLIPKADNRPSPAVGAAKKSLQKAKRSLARKRADAKPKRRKQPTKIFRTRYRINEMRRKIEESRASDFFDFFYGLGLIPVSKDSDDAWSLLHETPLYSRSPGPNLLDSAEGPAPPRVAGRRYLAWKPRSGPCLKKEDPDPSDPGCSGDDGPSHFSLLCQTRTFFDSLRSETALSPEESPVIPEQLEVAKRLFPPVGFERSEEPVRQKLRPRSSEQLQRLADCFAGRRKRPDAASTPLNADQLYDTPRKSATKPSSEYGKDGSLMKRLRNDIESFQPKAKKEHFEEGVTCT